MPVIKVIELVGTSSDGLEAAVQEAITEAAKTIRHIVGADILGWTTKIKENKVVEWRANVKISFLIEGER
jgi:flavin-binding protein dodecin